MISNILGTGTLFLHILIGFVVLLFLFRIISPKNDVIKDFIVFLEQKGLYIVYILLLSGVLGSLYYSNILGYEPCLLCWWQRIFIYSSTVILTFALYWKELIWASRYVFVLLIPGAILAGYQYIQQMFDISQICNADGIGVSCSTRYVFLYGYITIPLMAFTSLLVSLIILFLHNRKHKVKHFFGIL